MMIQVECDELQSQALNVYAKHKGVTLSNLLLEAALEELEDEYDRCVLAEEALQDSDNDQPNISHENLGRMLGLR